MVNLHDPPKAPPNAYAYLAAMKLWHTVDGLYIWEFVTTLDYEWDVFCRRRQYLWTIWVYSLTRVTALLAVIVNMIGIDVNHPTNSGCQAWITPEAVFTSIPCLSTSLLIVFRTIAIWKKNRIVIMISVGAWLINLALFIDGVVKLRAAWVSAADACDVPNVDSTNLALLSNTITDMILLLTMLIGLFRLRLDRGMFSLGRLLWTQGIVWLLFATVAEIIPTVLAFSNLNEPFKLMFETPALIMMAIVATRMYRSLTDFGSSDIPQDGPKLLPETTPTRVSAGHIPLNRLEVLIHMQSEQYSDFHISMDGQPYDIPQGFAIDDNVECGQETKDHGGSIV